MKLYDDMIITGNRAIAKSYAKINLTLDVLGRLENGYHEVRMIMQSLNLFDLVIVDKNAGGIRISTGCKSIPSNSQNIAYKAAELFFAETGIHGGAKILIHKNIPVAAGLAGGSGNAAAVLCALNLLYDAHLSDGELGRLALMLGADVPYCISGGTYLAEGIGEKLTKLPDIPNIPVVLVKPPVNISTAEIYRKIDFAENLTHPDTDAVISAISEQNTAEIARRMTNLMENVTSADCPEITEIKNQMISLGALGSIMSGSGPTVFGLFKNNDDAKSALNFFFSKYSESYLAHTIS